MAWSLFSSTFTKMMVAFFFFFWLELRAYTSRHSTSPFSVLGIFKIGSHELFAQAGFEL
jgi:hypothetical protein